MNCGIAAMNFFFKVLLNSEKIDTSILVTLVVFQSAQFALVKTRQK